MKIYFVRHGQSIFNKEQRHQFPDTPLSDQGLKQASAIANRFTNIQLDLILSSPYKRALSTAQAIESIKSVPLIESSLLAERMLPTTFRGKLHGDLEIAPIHQMIRDHADNPTWHYADEENFTDLTARAKVALSFIVSQSKENIAVVTHGYFLTMLITYIIFKDRLSHQIFKSFRDHISYSNTGLTMCEYQDKKWTLLTWNDYAHLGE